jgi:hypothetical protein
MKLKRKPPRGRQISRQKQNIMQYVTEKKNMTGNLRRSSRKKDRHLTHFEPDDTGSMYI